jgi:hypothetical protein
MRGAPEPHAIARLCFARNEWVGERLQYFISEGEQLLPDAGDFEPVGNGTERMKSQESGPGDLAEVLGENLISLPVDTTESPEADEPVTTVVPLPDTRGVGRLVPT